MTNQIKNSIDSQINIIIPIYGVEKYIGQFLESLISQTFKNYTAIFIDDKTEDRSMEIVEKYKDQFYIPPIIIRNEVNKGLSGSRNEGLKVARRKPTKYVTFLDPDDWLDNTYLEDLYNQAEERQLELCISGLIRYDEDRDKNICIEMISFDNKCVYSPENCRELAYINPCSYSKLFLFQLISDIDFRPVKRSEDLTYLFEALTRYNRIGFTNNALLHYRVRSTSLTGGMNYEKYNSMHSEFIKLLEELRTRGFTKLCEQYEAQIFTRCSIGAITKLFIHNRRNMFRMEREELAFLDLKMPGWRVNPFLCITKGDCKNYKELMLKNCAILYKVHCFWLFVYMYYCFTRMLKIEIRP